MRCHFVTGIALGLTFGMCLPASVAGSRLDPPAEGEWLAEGTVLIVSADAAAPAPPTYVLPPIEVVEIGNTTEAMTVLFSQVWGLTYDPGNCGLKLEGVQGGVGTIVAGDQREAGVIVGQSVVLINQDVMVPNFASMMVPQGIVSSWSVVAADIVGASGVTSVVGLRIQITGTFPGTPSLPPEALLSMGDGVLLVTSVVPSSADSVALSAELATGLEQLGSPPAPSPALGREWDGHPSQAECLNFARQRYDDCCLRAFRGMAACAATAASLALGLMLGCAALTIGFFVCALVVLAAEALALIACKLIYENDLSLCREVFVDYARTACGSRIAWI